MSKRRMALSATSAADCACSIGGAIMADAMNNSASWDGRQRRRKAGAGTALEDRLDDMKSLRWT
ncbi:hypothetical protein D3C75_1377740 [compost metagenome]